MLLDLGPDRQHLSDRIHPDPTSPSFEKPCSDMNMDSGCPRFVPHSVIDNSSYVQDDAIYIRILVDTTGFDNM